MGSTEYAFITVVQAMSAVILLFTAVTFGGMAMLACIKGKVQAAASYVFVGSLSLWVALVIIELV